MKSQKIFFFLTTTILTTILSITTNSPASKKTIKIHERKQTWVLDNSPILSLISTSDPDPVTQSFKKKI